MIDSIDQRILRLALRHCLVNTTFDRVDLLVSFIMRSGLRLVDRNLEDAIERGACIRVLTPDYLMVTHPDALARLLDLSRVAQSDTRRGQVELRVFHDPLTSFHPKAYMFWSSTTGLGRGFVGSNNLSLFGIETGVEWSVQTAEINGLVAAFERLWNDPRSTPIDDDWLMRTGTSGNAGQPSWAPAATCRDRSNSSRPLNGTTRSQAC